MLSVAAEGCSTAAGMESIKAGPPPRTLSRKMDLRR